MKSEKGRIHQPGLLRLDTSAASADENLPAFLARPQDAPIYHGFPILGFISDGWKFGTITDYTQEAPIEEGDAFIIAPDGSRAGIAWALDTPRFYQIIAPEKHRWGVYGLCFAKAVSCDQDLVDNLLPFLPELKEKWEKARAF